MHGRRPIFYATSSREDLRAANFLQVRQMASAFADRCEVTVGLKAGPVRLEWPSRLRVLRWDVPPNRLGNFRFSIAMYRWFRSHRRHFDFVYSRNPFFSILLGRASTRRHGFEFHHFLEGASAIVFQRLLLSRVDVIVTITRALRQRVISADPTCARRTLVQHDAHSNVLPNRPRNPPVGRAKVGYFGKLIPLKGVKLLHELVHMAADFDFYIFTPHPERAPKAPNVVEAGFLPHDTVASKMREMDFLLLPVVPQGTRRDFTPYTSPLKLFEYASVGGVILASDVPAIREVLVSGQSALLLPNAPAAWLRGLHELHSDDCLYRRLSAGALNVARQHTWRGRALAILDALEAPFGVSEGDRCSHR